MKSVLLLLALLATGAGHTVAVAAAGVEITDAWIREAPPGASMLAAYLTIDNPTDRERVLTGVSSPRFAHVMMHRSEIVDGMARMIHEDRISIPARGRLEFRPGGRHLMMPAPDRPLQRGESVPFELRFADGERLEVNAEVRKP